MLLYRERYKAPISLFLLILFINFYFGVEFSSLFANDNSGAQQETVKKSEYSTPVFKPGDAVQIIVFPDTTSFLNNTFPIDDQGYVFLPLVGRTKISNKSKKEFLKFLTDNYSQYLKFPFIQVRPLIRISILGGVQKPGMYYVDPSLSLWETIKISGGPLKEDGLKEMRWERNKKVVKDDLIPYLQSGQSLRNIGFRSGDQIWVPSPDRPTFWTRVGQVLPIVSFAISTYTLYWAIQNGVFRGRGAF